MMLVELYGSIWIGGSYAESGVCGFNYADVPITYK